jgi:oligopeptide transport system permease protein
VISYSLKRFLGALPTLLVIITIAFFMIKLTPGGPFDSERPIPEEIKKNLDKFYGLDKPLWQQYTKYLKDIVSGDFGPSFQYKDFTVNELVWGGFPVSLKLGMWAILIAVILGTLLGSFAALKQNSWVDYSIMTIAMVGITIPNFVIAPIMQLVFGVNLKWLPVGGWGGGDFKHMVLPVIALALPQIAYIARMTRGSMIEVLRSNYIRTARAKGLSEYIIVLRHALRASLLPVVSYLGPATANVITGSVVIETIFGIPGIGRYFIQGALNRDYTLVMGVVVFFGMLIIVFNLLVDLIYGLLDPRVRYD